MSDDKPLVGLDMTMTFTLPAGYDPKAWSVDAIVAVANAIAEQWPTATPDRRVVLRVFMSLVIDKFYELPDNEAGGNLHVVLDDCNLDDDCIVWGVERAIKADDVAAVAIGEMLLVMTYRERLEWDGVCPCCIEQLRADCEHREAT